MALPVGLSWTWPSPTEQGPKAGAGAPPALAHSHRAEPAAGRAKACPGSVLPSQPPAGPRWLPGHRQGWEMNGCSPGPAQNAGGLPAAAKIATICPRSAAPLGNLQPVSDTDVMRNQFREAMQASPIPSTGDDPAVSYLPGFSLPIHIPASSSAHQTKEINHLERANLHSFKNLLIYFLKIALIN